MADRFIRRRAFASLGCLVLGFAATALPRCAPAGVDGPGLCTEDRWCDGDLLMACDDHCTSDLKCSHRVRVASDCREVGDKLGVVKTCRPFITSNESVVLGCLDADAPPCTIGSGGSNVSCTAGGKIAVCRNTPDGLRLDTDQACPSGQTCHPAEVGVFCYTPPGTSCAPGTAQYCSDEKTLMQCKGTPSSGYVLLANDCGPAHCSVNDAGTALCR